MTARKKSETRQRNKQSKIRWLDAEFNTAAAKAQASGLSFSAYVRASATGSAPRRRTARDAEASGAAAVDRHPHMAYPGRQRRI